MKDLREQIENLVHQYMPVGVHSYSLVDEIVQLLQEQESVSWRNTCGAGSSLAPMPPSVPDFADAYQGAMEELAIWKKRALEAEVLNRKFIAEINGPTHMGEPVATPPSVPEWIRVVDEEMVCSHLGVADAGDAYDTAKSKLHQLIRWHITVATDPTVNGGYVLVPVEPTPEICAVIRNEHDIYGSAEELYRMVLDAAAPKPGEGA